MDLFSQLHLPDFALPATWISIATLSFLEIVLGVDNIIFISLVAGKLPLENQRRARNIGLILAMVFRVCLLLTISWIISLTQPLFTLPIKDVTRGTPYFDVSWRDAILLAGGIFLIVKSTLEIHNKMQTAGIPLEKQKPKKGGSNAVTLVILQIILVDMIFSFDSILTAIGLVENVVIMIIAVLISIVIMMLFAGAVMRVINGQPTLQMLALSFLVVIGVILVADGIHQHVSKNIIYSCLAFSLGVELLNSRLRKKEASANQVQSDTKEQDS